MHFSAAYYACIHTKDAKPQLGPTGAQLSIPYPQSPTHHFSQLNLSYTKSLPFLHLTKKKQKDNSAQPCSPPTHKPNPPKTSSSNAKKKSAISPPLLSTSSTNKIPDSQTMPPPRMVHPPPQQRNPPSPRHPRPRHPNRLPPSNPHRLPRSKLQPLRRLHPRRRIPRLHCRRAVAAWAEIRLRRDV